MPHYIHSIRTCVFRLDNIFDGTVFRESQNPPPDFIWSQCSHIEELIILVGGFRKEVPPSRMKVIKAFQANLVSFKDTLSEFEDEMSEHEDTRYVKYLLESERYMIEDISRHWSLAFQYMMTIMKFLFGWQPLKDTTGLGMIGMKVLSQVPGSRFLASASGWWWLASDFGFPWLETEQGLGWLDTHMGRKFLKIRQALLWLNTGTYTSSSLTPLGTQVWKAWFNTVAGIEWKFQNCPDGNPPAPPRPPQRDSTPPPNVEFPIYFKNPHFRGWRFVICPEEIAKRAASRRK
ncbi:hypothetical protein F4813DRAFT_354530 [Daldinia decipiens]|uniref:uncharacterized protein n=1 Tax=Daldinia decipiens TaxID=326647 RepID=UPI0020C39CEB|nr:uncharacterized protein F4813DRAFT_354530 [Daldinia decipiens]KAI1659308.1 hypothetical protein F4813DRAFT_354530 [Daldinia decipiens]